ncbi:MAG: alpha/beta fold hydrolase [Pseudonocardiaceae bacterium]
MAAERSPVADGDEYVTTSDGTRLAVYRHGPTDAPVTVVLAHGWTLDSRTWEPVVARLLAGPQAVGVVCYDHRGHGRSDDAGDGSATMARLGDDLAELLAHAVEGPVVLAGHSMGGMAMMALAERHPELVARRVVGAAFVATSCGDLAVTLGLRPLVARLVAGAESAVLRRVASSDRLRARRAVVRRGRSIRPGVRWLLFGGYAARADIDLTAQCIAECRPATVVDFRPALTEHDRRAALTAFAVIPTVVLGGARDRLIPASHSRTIAAELADARLVVYADAGHMVPLERADQVAVHLTELVGARPQS